MQDRPGDSMSHPGPAYRGSVSPFFLGLGMTCVTFLSHCRQGIGWSENILLVPKVLFLEGRSSLIQTKFQNVLTCAVRGQDSWLSWVSRLKSLEENALLDLGSKSSICKGGLGWQKRKGFPRVAYYPPSSEVSKLSLPWEREECAVGPAPLPQLAWAQLEAEHVEKAWAAREDAVGGMKFAIIRQQGFPQPQWEGTGGISGLETQERREVLLSWGSPHLLIRPCYPSSPNQEMTGKGSTPWAGNQRRTKTPNGEWAVTDCPSSCFPSCSSSRRYTAHLAADFIQVVQSYFNTLKLDLKTCV